MSLNLKYRNISFQIHGSVGLTTTIRVYLYADKVEYIPDQPQIQRMSLYACIVDIAHFVIVYLVMFV